MFSVDDPTKRLTYAPFQRYQLPTLVGRRSSYRLQWPGDKVGVPPNAPGSWDDWETDWEGTALPESLAYHMAVNAVGGDGFKVPPVAGLSGVRVSQVLNACFSFPGEVRSTLEYLKWLAEGHWEHPLFQGFDNLTEGGGTQGVMLAGIQREAVRAYFRVLATFRHEDGFQDNLEPSHETWARLATYLHWVGRVAPVDYHRFADIELAVAAPGLEDLADVVQSIQGHLLTLDTEES